MFPPTLFATNAKNNYLPTIMAEILVMKEKRNPKIFDEQFHGDETYLEPLLIPWVNRIYYSLP